MSALRWFFICLSLGSSLAANTPRMLLLGAALTDDGIVAVGERGTILHSNDDGVEWQSIPSSTHTTLTAVAFAPDGQRGWAVGHDALILATADGGQTWSTAYQGENLEDSFLDVAVIDAQTIIAIGAYGQCVWSRDSGTTWQLHSVQDDDSHLNKITTDVNGTVYIAGERGTLLRSLDQGATWDSIQAPYDGSFYGILSMGDATLLAYGLRGHIYRSTDDGENWNPIALTSHPLIADACLLATGEIVLAGQARTFLISRDHGQSFQPWPQSLITGVSIMLQTPRGRLLVFGENGVSTLALP